MGISFPVPNAHTEDYYARAAQMVVQTIKEAGYLEESPRGKEAENEVLLTATVVSVLRSADDPHFWD